MDRYTYRGKAKDTGEWVYGDLMRHEQSHANWCIEYDDEKDEYFLLEGFYEVINNWDDYSSVTIDDFVTHASEQYLDRYISRAYSPGIKASEIVADLSKQTGLAIGEITLAKDIQYPRGRSVIGKLRAILKDVTVNDCKTNLQIVNGSVMIRNIGEGIATGFILSATTGMIGSPEPITDTSDIESDIRLDYKVRCQLNHKIRPMVRLRIDSRVLKADVVVLRGSHIGSKEGNFETEMEVKMI